MEQNNSKPAVRKQKIAKDSKALYTIISILVGFAIGAIMLIVVNVSPIKAYGLLVESVFGTPKNMAQSIV